jgi:hypothetical protein
MTNQTAQPASSIPQAIDEHGNPMVRITGCPNCGEGAGWMNPIEYSAKRNSGLDPNAACSRACALQTEYADEISEREGETSDAA